VLGDDTKRSQYDTFGTTSDAAGSGGFDPGAAYGSQSGGFRYQSQVDPEELFRTIFGDAFGKGRDFESMFNDEGTFNDQKMEISQVKWGGVGADTDNK
jgi:DnaJ family protein A protein 3